jgi:hypothetical protein
MSRSIDTTPMRGPGTSSTNASLNETVSRTSGSSQMVTTVSVKPIASCTVTAVPT